MTWTFDFEMPTTKLKDQDLTDFNIHECFLWKEATTEDDLKFAADLIIDQHATIGNDNTVKKDIRNHLIGEEIEIDAKSGSFFMLLKERINSVNFFHYNYRLWSVEALLPCKYDENHFYKMHSDRIMQKSNVERKMTVLIGLTNESAYQGGEVIVSASGNDKYSTIVRLNRGDMLFIPSFVPYSVSKIKSGSNQMLISWVLGPKFV
jgi:hypothetical protein